ncbi:MAG: glucose PTS transporter subunit IIA [Intestinibaculum porci]|uniref:PTS beta-glucoside transporter subunit IIBCA n=1 Tax=Intestinibaculum porci TaxID=2487118 RepID=UPI003F07B4EA
MEKKDYESIAEEIIQLCGGKKNILGIAHCATRLRLVLEDNDKADLKAIENVKLVKGVFVAGDQLQIIFGTGLVNDICAVTARQLHMSEMSLGDLKTKANKRMNPLQRLLKALSDVFIDIMPGILAAALLTGLSSLLGNWDLIKSNQTLYGITRIINISSGAIFGFLPLCVAYSTVKRFGGRPIMGIVIGCIMLTNSLADAYSAAAGTVKVETLHLLGLPVQLVGFQGGIIVALLIGIVVAKLDIFFEKKVPDVIKLLVSPLLTTLCSTFLLFIVVGPLGRALATGLTNGLIWLTQNLGVVGYAIFGGVQQLIVITGLHHVFGAVEAQLIASTGRDFLNPLMSVAIIAQGGAVLGYLARNWQDAKAKELTIPSFISTLFGITEPAIFGVNLRYRYPLVGGCIGGAIGGALCYFFDLAGKGFGTTVLPGIALCDPANNGYLHYIIAHCVALACGFGMTLLLSLGKKNNVTEQVSFSTPVVNDPISFTTAQSTPEEIEAFADGQYIAIEDVKDPTFAKKVMGDGLAIIPENGNVYAPADGQVIMVFATKHAIGLRTQSGHQILLHAGIDTVNLQGQYMNLHVKEGQTVKSGDLLLSFDLEKIKEAGYDPTIIMVVTDQVEGFTLQKEQPGAVKKGTPIALFYQK